MMIFLIVLVLLAMWVIFGYNSLVTMANKTKEAWADIDVQLKRRYDLIPNLVSTVKGYSTHEEGVFESVTKARTLAMSAQTPVEKGQAEVGLASALKSVFALAEAYPELKANQNFLSLQTELTGTEDKIQAARRYYNGNVRDFNTAVMTFPKNLIANVFHFSKQEFFQLEDAAAKEPVQVKF